MILSETLKLSLNLIGSKIYFYYGRARITEDNRGVREKMTQIQRWKNRLLNL